MGDKLLLVTATILIGCAVAGGSTASFPTQKEAETWIRKGMTRQEVLVLMGPPTISEPEDKFGIVRLQYFAPVSLLTSQDRGYKGFSVLLREGRVEKLLFITGRPSLPGS